MRSLTLKYILIALVFFSFLRAALAENLNPAIPMSDCDTTYLSKELGLSWENDPFLKKPGFTLREADQDNLKLEAVIWDQNSPRAIVNGIGVKNGDKIQNKQVKKIGENYVVLEEGDSMMELAIPVKTSSNSESLISIEEVKK